MTAIEAIRHMHWKFTNVWRPTPKDAEAYNTLLDTVARQTLARQIFGVAHHPVREQWEQYTATIEIDPLHRAKWERWILYLLLKFSGQYTPEMDPIFNVTKKDGREYNPATATPSTCRYIVPDILGLSEYDIRRANPTFVAREIGFTYKTDPYTIIDKKRLNELLNAHKGTGTTIKGVRSELRQVYGEKVEQVMTEARFNEKGRFFRDMAEYERQAINEFIETNGITNYIRVHDAVITNEPVGILEVGGVQFVRKV